MKPKNCVFIQLGITGTLIAGFTAQGQTKYSGDDWPETPTPTATNIVSTAAFQQVESETTANAEPQEAAAPIIDQPSRFHLAIATEFTTAYFFRGIRQEDSGLIVQPYADAAIDAFRMEDASVSLKAGFWNSYHDASTGASSGDSFTKNWYESDLYAGFGVSSGKWSFDARYIWYTSPSNAFGTVDELDLSVAYDDTEWLGAWSMKPAATLATEVGSNAADGGNNGTYLQLSISPGLTFDAGSIKNVALTFPATVGLSLSDYYEGTGGEKDVLGYATVAAKLSVPLDVDASWGAWTLSASVQALFLGDAASTFNRANQSEIIGTVGISVGF